jgi:serine/threonine-protein kinase RIM15
MGLGVSELLHPGDSRKFKEASERLQNDDSHTVEIQFRIRVESDEESRGGQDPNALVYKNMEGSGMLMLDRVDHIPSHTMWVIKPAPVPEVVYPEEEEAEEEEEVVVFKRAGGVLVATNAVPQRHRRLTDAIPPSIPIPVFKTMSTTPILCRICENQIASWFFEKHNETCSDVHKFEADVAECNDGVVELQNTIRGLIEGIDKPAPSTNLEYRGILLFSPGATPNSSSPITVFRPPLASRVGRVGVRKAQRGVLEQVDEILQVAREISMPALREEEAKESIERQRLLSPASEDRIGLVRDWQKPLAEDPALSRLVQDAELLMRTKLDTVTRMQNTVRYSEKIRQEWEERYEMAVAQLGDDPQALPEEEAIALDSDDAASTTSEYDFGRETFTSEPTPVAASPIPPPVIPIVSPMPISATPNLNPLVHRAAYQGSYQGSGRPRYSRPSTPSSVTSPLALAAPIIASSPETTRPALPYGVEGSAQTIHARRSAQNLMSTSPSEPKLFVTPPVSPLISPRGSETTLAAPANKAHLRRLSTVRPILSPTTAVAPGPLSPRLPSMAPASKSAPSSIKDFDIIKPVSKGAFGSVFLAKKKTTGDYYAIKVLKKADMIAKNQITNVKAERLILMKQAESPFVVKLYFTFQSKENLYLVMEYLNGGDCAALIKTLGALPEEWTRAYVAEIVLALEYLHERGIVHR